MTKTFDELRRARLKWVEATKENDFEKGITNLLADLYPDNAHFIYELLQNAEDAGAHSVQFTLAPEAVTFEHDGCRLFTLEDVESITSIGVSTKRDDPTRIGKFGVGFKAVFAYTTCPEVHSGEFHFKISDLVVPERCVLTTSMSRRAKTRFVFPFNHPMKRSSEAKDEVKEALFSLGDNTLLFLKHICEIEYKLPNGKTGSIKRVDHRDGHVSIVTSHAWLGPISSQWLRFEAKPRIVDDDGEKKECRVAIAYRLDPTDKGKRNGQGWTMAPVERGQVSIFFPAEKETSNLRFHIHAPFASTVARDSVRDTKGNRQLLAAIAELVAESMESIRDRGLLTVSTLEMLPIQDDNLSRFYEPIRSALVQAFASKDLVPTLGGSHSSARKLLRGPADIVAQLSDDDLDIVRGKARPRKFWCANPPQVNQRADKFLESLTIEEWGWDDLSEALDCDAFRVAYSGDSGRPQRLGGWLGGKEDGWLQKFYALLYVGVTRWDALFRCVGLCLVRVNGETGDEMVLPCDAFFPETEVDRGEKDELWVKKETYSSGRSDSQKNNARLFLEYAGVKILDEKAALERELRRYEDDESIISESQHLKDLRKFVRFYAQRPGETGMFHDSPFLLGTEAGKSGARGFYTPLELCLDCPFDDTGLGEVAEMMGKHVLWEGYESARLGGEFVKFVKAVGVQGDVKIVEGDPIFNPAERLLFEDCRRFSVRWTSSSVRVDWTIVGIDLLLKRRSVERSRLIWDALIGAEAKVAKAQVRPNQRYPVREAASQLVCQLKTRAWIPDLEGNFRKPEDVSRTQLRPDFPYDNRNGLLDAIGFGANIRKETEQYQRRNLAAVDLGFGGVDEAEKVAKALKESGLDWSEAAAAILRASSKPEQPEEGVRDPKRRRKGVVERRENAPSRESIRRERAIQANINAVVAEAKAYLRAKYTNADRQMVCQACQSEMPFKLSGGEYYFEAPQAVGGMNKLFFENRLALCPTCAAMYQYARSSSDDELKRKISRTKAIGNVVELSVDLAGEQRVLRFVGTHFFDLREVIGG